MEETVYLAPDICHLSVGFLAVSRFTVMCGCVGRKSLLESFLKRSTLCGIWMPWGCKGWLAHCFIQLSLLYALRRPVHHKTTASLQLGFISFKVGFTVRTKGQDLSSYFQCWLDIFLSIAFRKRAREYFFFFFAGYLRSYLVLLEEVGITKVPCKTSREPQVLSGCLVSSPPQQRLLPIATVLMIEPGIL